MRNQKVGQVTRGVIRGTMWGVILGGVGVATASLVAPQPAGNTPPAQPQVSAPAVEGVAEVVADAPALPTPETGAQVGTASPTVTAPAPEVAEAIDTSPALAPDVATVEETPSAPATPEAPSLTAEREEPVLPNPQTRAPQVPANEGDLVVDTAPALPIVVEDPPEPDPEPEVAVAPEPEAEAGENVVVLPVEEPETVTPDPLPAVEPEAEVVADASEPDRVAADTTETVAAEATTEAAQPAADPDALDSTEPETLVAADPLPEVEILDRPAVVDPVTPEPAAEAAPEAATETAPEAVVAEVSDADTPEVTEVPAAPQVESPAADTSDVTEVEAAEATDVVAGEDVTPENVVAEAAPEETGTPAPDTSATERPAVVSLRDTSSSPLPQGSSGVRVNRTFGQGGADTTGETGSEVTEAPTATGGPALDQYAVAFDNAGARPLVSIVLYDTGGVTDGPAKVAALPFVTTVLVDPAANGAAASMAAYRAAGSEVGVALNLPPGARATDAAIALEAALNTLPETVALLRLDQGGGFGQREVNSQIVDTLRLSGHGLLDLSTGLSSGARLAEGSGVPAVSIFRDLDGEGQDAATVSRFLDQAAFRARQDGTVVLLARVNDVTLDALASWSAGGRASQVALAPVSAALAVAGN